MSADEQRAKNPVAQITERQRVSLADAEGRVLAVDLVSTLDLPPWPNSAMDGYALRQADWT
ncbi:molybdenum cofactor biosynthesis protein, partial [Pseudomonas syringae pv. actinidiae ICMP 19096]